MDRLDARALRRIAPPPRVVDWSILVVVTTAVGTGLLSWTGWLSPALLVTLHTVVSLTLVGLLLFKFARVANRVRDSRNWDRATPISVLLGAVVVAVLALGIFWGLGGNVPVGPWTTLNVHIGFGLLAIPLLLLHLRARLRLPSRTDASRRSALKTGGLLVAGVLAWRATEFVAATRDVVTRETGSKPIGDLADTDTEGGSFPVTSWVADDPDPVEPETWSLAVSGQVDEELELGHGDLPSGDERTVQRETLDCTSGWYTIQEWGGVRIGDLLDEAGVTDEAAWVRFVSVTGYRWSLPLAEAREALLATHVGGRPLSHGHGAPARLVAPGRRGFQWVKWVERVELRRDPDPAQWFVTLVSGFD
ncbi:MAG: molybdopterin-dependent oxidoreductase [Halolamina sp.]|uniref:molybdopterin-dependent oxidoreductase n=1 Tax=Halolamina sp. TaxID=1940283 RepID=UPI002FC31FED